MGAALVSIIGPPAAGKTTTAEWLAEAIPGRLIREDYDRNPFLASFYLGRRELALASQLYFLFSRVGQLERADWPEDGVAVSDYGFCHDRIYAERTLAAADLAVYDRLSVQAAGLVKPPDVLVYLKASDGLLLERIARRGRGYERSFTAEFIAALQPAYEQAAGEAPCPVLTVDVDRVDLRTAPARDDLLEAIRKAIA
jgi:deoxyadenosine/deoxycytidine kinase